MDPNATLATMQEAIRDFYNGMIDEDSFAAIMASHFSALDDWITKGGFLPTQWER